MRSYSWRAAARSSSLARPAVSERAFQYTQVLSWRARALMASMLRPTSFHWPARSAARTFQASMSSFRSVSRLTLPK